MFPRLPLLFVFRDLRVVPIPVVLDPLQDLSCVWMNQVAPGLPERLDNEIDEHHLGGEGKEEEGRGKDKEEGRRLQNRELTCGSNLNVT